MNIRDKIFYKETIKMANIPNTFCFLVDEKCKNEILEKFIDFSSIKNSIYPRYFEHLKKGLLLGTGWEIVENIINLKLEGNFYIFIDDATAIYKIIHWDNVCKIIYEWGSFDMYIVSESYDFMICLTNENNVIISGENSKLNQLII